MNPKIPLSYIELSKTNLLQNIVTVRRLVKQGTKLVFPVKGNAYGHGEAEIVRMSEKLVDYFLVNSIEELRVLRKVSKKPTLLFGYVSPRDIAEAIALGAILGIFSKEQFITVSKIAKKKHVKPAVHIACDALLGREGFLESELEDFFMIARTHTHMRIAGLYAHFANIEDTNNFTHAQKQIDAYERMKTIAQKCGFGYLDTHISATSGLFAYEKDVGRNTLVRTGIGIYGLWPSDHLLFAFGKKVQLAPVLSWKTHIAQIKRLPAGRTIGYGLAYMTKKLTTIALIPQGYADGYPRCLSNKGYVLIEGKRCPVLGRIAMNMFVVDVTKVKDVKENDEVVLLGTQGKAGITAEELAGWSDTINYEVVTRISPLLPRIIR